MGTQQILLIVLSVIIVGIAVAVGITMFNTQAINSNRDACIADMNNFAVQAAAWFKTPASHGGCGADSGHDNYSNANLIAWIGYSTNTDGEIETGNGSFAVDAETSAGTVVFTAKGKEGADKVKPATTAVLATGAVSTVANPT